MKDQHKTKEQLVNELAALKTECQRMQETLQKSETQWRSLIQDSPDHILTLDRDLIIQYANFASPGLTLEELIGTPITAHLAPERQPEIKAILQNVLRTGEPAQYRTAYDAPNRTLTYESRVVPRAIAGERVGLTLIARDITEQARAESQRDASLEALRESQQHYRALFENAGDAIHLTNENDEILDVNPRMCELMGYSRQELLSMRVPDLQAPEVRGTAGSVIKGDLARHGHATFEALNVHRDGTRIPIEVTLSRIADSEGDLYFSILRDITERVRMDAVLRESEARLQSIFRAAPVGIGLVSDRVLLQVNDRLCEMLNYSGDELIGKNARMLYPSDDDFEFVGREKYLQIQERGTGTVETRLVRKGGEILNVLLSSTPLDPADLAAGVTFTALDITDRVRADQDRIELLAQIGQQAKQLQEIMDTVPEGVLLLDVERNILLTNPLARQQLPALAGVEPGAQGPLTHLGGRPLAELLASPPQGLWHEVTADGPPPQTFEIIARPVENGPEPAGWVLVLRDVTQERDIQRQARQQDRLAAVGQLAAGIAHDFNNTLAIIILYAQMSQHIPDLPAKIHERLQIIDQQAQRASDLTRQILDFSRRSVLEQKPLNLAVLVKEQAKLLERTLPESIEIELTCGPDVYMVQADLTRMQQIVMNLAVNARDALPGQGGGKLHISLQHMAQEEQLPCTICGQIIAGREGWVQLAVADNGTGIPADVLPHIFEPFYTTKAPGAGSGLGLAQVYGIIKQHNGHIHVETKDGQGTTFTIYLPALAIPRPARTLSAELQDRPGGAGETILLVEDNPTARMAIAESLELLNYRVLSAANGREALTLYEEHATGSGQAIALVLSDLVMPEMGGAALAHALQEQTCAAPIIVMTGHPLENAVEELKAAGVTAWLRKPIDIDQLAQLLASTLTST